jgi:hypothetical protein
MAEKTLFDFLLLFNFIYLICHLILFIRWQGIDSTTDRQTDCRLRGRRGQQDLLPARTTPTPLFRSRSGGRRLLHNARCAENITEKIIWEPAELFLRHPRQPATTAYCKHCIHAQHEEGCSALQPSPCHCRQTYITNDRVYDNKDSILQQGSC